MKTTIILNKSILTNEDLATMAQETVELNEMYLGLWAIQVDQYAMFDCTDMQRHFDSTRHNAVVSVWDQPKVASTQLEELHPSDPNATGCVPLKVALTQAPPEWDDPMFKPMPTEARIKHCQEALHGVASTQHSEAEPNHPRPAAPGNVSWNLARENGAPKL